VFWLLLLFVVTLGIALAGQRLLERHSSRGGEKMTAQRNGNLPTLHFYEEELLHKARSDRRLAAGLLIFSMAFCALVFSAYFKEMLAYGKCDLGGTGCSTIASSSGASP
jgi:hypothetical protein